MEKNVITNLYRQKTNTLKKTKKKFNSTETNIHTTLKLVNLTQYWLYAFCHQMIFVQVC